MKTKEIIKRAREFAEPFRIRKGRDFRLKDVDPDDTLEFTKEEDKPRAKEALATGVTALAELQDKLYAQDKWAVIRIFWLSKNCRQSWSANKFGKSVSKTYAISSDTWRGTASSCGNSFFTFQKRNRNDDSSSESMTRRRTGSSRPMTPMSAIFGTITWKRTKK